MIPMNEYTNGDWRIRIYPDGTKERFIFSENPITEFPESIDVKINSWCDAACSYCHEDSTRNGIKSPDLSKVLKLYSQLPKGVEIAIGGGHPLAHEGFDEFVTELRNMGVHCNVTVNEFHFKQERARLERMIVDGKIKGVGYSYSSIPLDWSYENAVTHVITGVTNSERLHDIIENNSGKVLLLGYKNFRRGSKFLTKHQESVERNILSWYRNLFSVVRDAKVSFDNLAIEQLQPKRVLSDPRIYEQLFMGEDGTHTMYIDATTNEYTRSSTTPWRIPIGPRSIQTIFNDIKQQTLRGI